MGLRALLPRELPWRERFERHMSGVQENGAAFAQSEKGYGKRRVPRQEYAEAGPGGPFLTC